MREEEGIVYDFGYFQFERNMIQSIDTFELINIPIPDIGTIVRMLQFYVEVAAETAPRAQRVTHQRTANLGTGRTGGGPANARTISERDGDGNNGSASNEDGDGNSNMDDGATIGGVTSIFSRNVRNRLI
jgi:hypothetical protein